MEHIRETFSRCKSEGRSALVTFVTAGYPTVEETPDIMLAMQAGGSDIIELGIPFTDPSADGKTIQKANLQALQNAVTIPSMLKMVRDARQRGLYIPVVFMGYYNPVMRYGDERLMRHCKASGVNAFIMVDLPPEESLRFRGLCKKAGLSYIPLIAPCTTDNRMKFLCSIADSFVYVVSKMGVTGASSNLNSDLPDFLDRVHKHTRRHQIPAAVGFGINTREHFVSVSRLAEGVVIGSKIISVLGDAPAGQGAQKVKEYCSYITERNVPQSYFQALSRSQSSIPEDDTDDIFEEAECEGSLAPSTTFGGQYVPEVLIESLSLLEDSFNQITNDPSFWEEFNSFFPYMNRPSCLHVANHLSEYVGGANIWLKREDLNHTGSHHINNALGQVLLARRLGKTQVIAETGDGQHGLATATVCAKFDMKCTIFMGAKDVRRQELNVFQMKVHGATVVTVDSGAGTLREATNEALRAFVVDLQNTYYIPGSPIGPHPLPAIVRTFQSVVGNETREEFVEKTGQLPDAVVACVGSDATGMFYSFIKNNDPVKMVGVEAAGEGLDTERHSAVLTKGSVGVLHGSCTYVLQDCDGQIQDTHSIAAGLDYPAVGPELASWHQTGKVTIDTATDKEALYGFMLLSQLEGIIPALESAHAVVGAIRVAKKLGKGKNIVLGLSGRGDKDVGMVAEQMSSEMGWIR